MTRQASADGTIDYRFSYDEAGRICRASDVISGRSVTRTFDSAGRLIGDGDVTAEVSATGRLTRITLSDGTSVRYEGDRIVRSGSATWTMEGLRRDAVVRPAAQAYCVPSEVEFHDSLGCWKEKFIYDELNQLQEEEGEFHLKAEFDPFGTASRMACCRCDSDGNVVREGGRDHERTFEYDAFGRLVGAIHDGGKERYSYDGFGRLQEIVHDDGTVQRLCWLGSVEVGAIRQGVLVDLKIPHPTSLVPIAIEVLGHPFRVDTDARGSITALYDGLSGEVAEVYRYSAFGDLHVYGASLDSVKPFAISPWLYCGKRFLKGSGTFDFGARRYCVSLMRWVERDPLGIVDTIDDRIYVRNNPMAFTDPSGLFPWFLDWSSVGDSIIHALQTAAKNAYKSVTFAQQRSDWLHEFRATYEDLFFKLVGQIWLRCMGYNLDASALHVHGEGEKHPKVRITLINGILNGIPEAGSSAALLSSTHGDVSVHFIYAATEGLAGDMLRGAVSKAGLPSRQAKLLAALWRQLIDEMGGVEGGGTILHYAHSLGATDTLNALQLLELNERQLIRTSTFGSPTLLNDGVCGKVDNYVSMNDGVPVIDYQRYCDGANGMRANVHFVPSDCAIPLIDHYFDGKTYRGVLEMLGQKFQEEFLLAQR
jgi:RHS repeat-associated protein